MIATSENPLQLELPSTRRAVTPATPRKSREWTCPELAILREHYPSGGVPACRGLLPGRSEIAIYAKASMDGLARPAAKSKRRTPYDKTEALDAEITRLYRDGIRRGQMQRFATAGSQGTQQATEAGSCAERNP